MAALWRQKTALHPTFHRFNQCMKDDWFLLPFELRLQRAHARALEAGGLLNSEESTAIDSGLDQIERDYGSADCPASDAEDLHTWIESELTTRVGEAGKKIHTARSRNDQVATLLKMFVISTGERLAADLRGLLELCCRRALAWSDVPLVLHTHQQFAAPGNAGFWVLRYGAAWERLHRHAMYFVADWRRYCPLGSGAVSGSSLPVNRNVQAEELGFGEPSVNALESTSCREECVELLNLAAQTALHLQSFAADVILFSQTPLSWIHYPADFSTGSSMMPNKMNPDAVELLRGESNSILAAQVQMAMILKGLPSGYDRDLQCVKPIVRDTANLLHQLCEMTVAFIDRLEFDVERTKASMLQGAVDATLLMEEKVRGGEVLRDAHRRIADAVQAGQSIGGRTPQELITAYCTPGSASPEETRVAAQSILERLSQPRGVL